MGVISRLRGDKQEDKPDVEIPEPDEKESALVEQWQRDYEDAKAARSEFAHRWQTLHDYVTGNQWQSVDDDDDWMPRPVTNICENFIDNAHANMTSSKVAITIQARRPGYNEVAAKAQDAVVSEWQGLDMDAKLRNEGEYIRPEVGTVILKSPWNPKRNNGKGGIDCEIVHPMNVFVDPNISNPRKIQDADFIDCVMSRNKSYMLRHYTKERDKMCRFTREQLEQILTDESTSDVEYTGENSYSSNRVQVMLHEYWYRNDDGKLQVAWIANNRVLKCTEDDAKFAQKGFYPHQRYPIVVIQYKPKPKSLYGRSEIDGLIPSEHGRTDGIQDCINKLDQKVMVAAALAAIGQIKYVHGKVRPETLSTEPGLKIPIKESTSHVEHVRSGEVPQFLMLWRDRKIKDAELVTNQHDVARGEPSSGRRTAAESLARREQALKPQNDRVETLNDGLAELAELWLLHMAYMGYEREYEMATPQGPKVFTFDPSKELFKQSDKPSIDEEVGEDDSSSRLIHFKATVDVGANLVLTKAFLYELGFGLWDRKAITPSAFYAMMPDFPGKSESLPVIEKLWQMQVQPQPPQQTSPQIQEGEPTDTTQQQGQGLSAQLQQFIDSLPEDVQAQIAALPTEDEKVQALADLYMQAMQGGMQGQIAQ